MYLNTKKVTIYFQSERAKKCTIYEMGKLLGEGSYGHVHRCVYPNQDFVLKHGFRMTSNKIELQFYRNVIEKQELQNIKCTPTIHGLYETSNKVYILMDYVDGGHLKSTYLQKYLKKHNDPLQLLISIMHQTIKALFELHEKEYIHNDIKPENVMIDSKEQIKIIDYGFTTKDRDNNQFAGTPIFFSPDIINGAKMDEKKDIWALGLTMYEIIVGEDKMIIGDIMKLNHNSLTIKLDKLDFTLDKMRFYFENALYKIEHSDRADAFADLIFDCLDDTGRFRPTSKEVIDKIKELENKNVSRRINRKKTILVSPKVGILYSLTD